MIAMEKANVERSTKHSMELKNVAAVVSSHGRRLDSVEATLKKHGESLEQFDGLGQEVALLRTQMAQILDERAYAPKDRR